MDLMQRARMRQKQRGQKATGIAIAVSIAGAVAVVVFVLVAASRPGKVIPKSGQTRAERSAAQTRQLAELDRKQRADARRLADIPLWEYNGLQLGSSLDEVTRILERPGVELSSNRTDLPGGGHVVTRMLQWTNSDGSNVVLMFQDDRLTTKAQHGLR